MKKNKPSLLPVLARRLILRITCQTIHIDLFVIPFTFVRYENLTRKINGMGLLIIEARECLAMFGYMYTRCPWRIRAHMVSGEGPVEPIIAIRESVNFRKKRSTIIFFSIT